MGVKYVQDLTSFFLSRSIFRQRSPSVMKQSRSTTATGVVFFFREIFAIEVCVKNESGASIVSRTHQTLFLWLQLYSCHGK